MRKSIVAKNEVYLREEKSIKLGGINVRPIKFRGKAVMTKHELDYQDIPNLNGWVRGSLTVDGEDFYIVGDIVEASDNGLIHKWWAKVHVESVGQYLGLKDKNDREIYEGDIVNYPHIVSAKSEWEVVFRKGGFVIKQKYLGISFSELVHINNLEVISNVYEDKHLLEVQM